jgi:uncharacterized membrane protein HdeD (DUF308 family)
VSISPPVSSSAPPYDEHASLRRAWWQLLALGLVSVIVGFLAIVSPYVATGAVVVVCGVLLLIAGVTEVIHAVMVRNVRGFALHLLAAALYLLVGLFILEDQERAASVLTLLLVAAFIVGGVLRIVFSLVVQFPAWPWVLLHGAVDLLLGFFIWTRWPGSSDWVIGLFIGIDLLFNGWSWMIQALTLRTFSEARSAGLGL